MNAHDAAEKLRPTFHLEQMPTEDRHHMQFVEAVAAELGVEATPFNLQQVAHALDEADIHGDDLHFPLMLYSRQHHAVDGVAASTYYPRHDMTFVTVENEEQMQQLGPGWFENPADLPPRGEIPIDAPPMVKKDLPEPDHELFMQTEHVAQDTRRADELKAEQDEQARIDAAEKAVADERARMAALRQAANESQLKN